LSKGLQDPGHISFASTHAGKKPFETVALDYGAQVLWPDHCVQGTPGADFHKDLKIPHAELIIRKGLSTAHGFLLGLLRSRRQGDHGLRVMSGIVGSAPSTSSASPRTSA